MSPTAVSQAWLAEERDLTFDVMISGMQVDGTSVTATRSRLPWPWEGEAATRVFRDDDSSVFEGDIEWLAATGITAGCNPPDNTLFCPDDPVTRGQMAAFLRRALD